MMWMISSSKKHFFHLLCFHDIDNLRVENHFFYAKIVRFLGEVPPAFVHLSAPLFEALPPAVNPGPGPPVVASAPQRGAVRSAADKGDAQGFFFLKDYSLGLLMS